MLQQYWERVSEYIYIYIYIYIFIFFVVVAKKAVISEDIKAERKSNPLKTLTGKKEFIMFLSIPNNTKNPKNENTNMNWKNKIT